METLIRPVLPRDVQAVVTLVGETLAEFGLRFGVGAATDDDLKRLPESYVDSGGAFWVAVDSSDRVVGTCGVFPVTAGDMELRKMYLRADFRGRGVGKRLLDEAIAWCRARGAKRVVLDTIDQMTGAIALYEANGFVRDDTQVRGARCSRGYARKL